MKALTLEAAPGARRALLVPGNDLRGEFYRPLGEALAARGVTTTLLTLEHGPATSWPACVAELHAAFDAHAGPGGLLVGHSLGGLMALLVAARRPAGLSGLVLLEPAVAPWRWLAARAAQRYRREVVLRDRERFVNWTGTFLRVARPAAFPARAMELYLAARREDDPAPVGALLDALPGLYPLPLGQVQAPVLVVGGARSGWRARLGLWLLARRLGARRATIAGAAHWLANEADEAVADAIASGNIGPVDLARIDHGGA